MSALATLICLLTVPGLSGASIYADMREAPRATLGHLQNGTVNRDLRSHNAERRVVILGSSNAVGSSASQSSRSWAGLLADALRGRAIPVVNASIGGTNTADSISRFERDVARYDPDFVILATSILNEQLLPNVPTTSEQFLQNTRQLIARVEAIGAIPILITPYTNAGLNPALRQQMLQISREFEAEGVTVWDFWNVMDDGTGHWLPGLSADGTHVGDTGHLNLFESIPLGFFDFAGNPNRPLPPLQGFGSWVADAGDGSQPSINVSPASPAPSWSAAFWTRAGSEGEEKTLLEVSGPAARVRRIGKRFELLLGDQVAAVGDVSEQGGFQHLCLTHQGLTGLITLYVNGAAAGATTVAGAESARLFTLGTTREQPGIQGESVAQFLVYRTPLCAEDVRELAAGRIPVKSLEAHLPLAQSPARRNQNAGPTIVDVVIGGTWHWVVEGPRTTAAP
jgi:lysophospholipase L1-like esterase